MAPRSSEGIPSQGQEFHHLHIVWKFVAKQPRWLIASWVSLFAISTLALVLYIVGTPPYLLRQNRSHHFPPPSKSQLIASYKKPSPT